MSIVIDASGRNNPIHQPLLPANKIYCMKANLNSTFQYKALNNIYNFLIGLECNMSWTTAVWVSPFVALTTSIPHNNTLVNISFFLVFPLLDLTSLSLFSHFLHHHQQIFFTLSPRSLGFICNSLWNSVPCYWHGILRYKSLK